MISMTNKQRIIIGHFNDGKSARHLAKELGLNRRTVQKYINEHKSLLALDDPSAPVAEDGIVDPPRYRGSPRRKSALTEEVCRRLDAFLELNAEHRKAGRGKQQMKTVDMLEALLEEGFSIGYTSVCRYVNTQRAKGKEAFIRQFYVPGQSVEFDWGEVELVINGQTKRLMLAVFTSAYSNHRWSMLFYRQDMISFLTAHVCYLTMAGGVAGEFVYDNMRVAVAEFACRNKDKRATEDLLRLSAYYGFSYRFCNVRRGNEKGHVERSVEYVRRKAFSRKIEFPCLCSANTHLNECQEGLNGRCLTGKQQTIVSLFEREQEVMKTIPITPFDPAANRQLRVDKYSCVRVDNNYYSVPDHQIGRYVDVRVYAMRIEVYDRDTSLLMAKHERRHTSHQYYMTLEHFLPTLQRKPGALLGSLAWRQAGESLQLLLERHFDKTDIKSFIAFLLWAQDKSLKWEVIKDTAQKLHERRPHAQVDIDALKISLLAQSKPKNTAPDYRGASTEKIRQNAADQLQQYQQLFTTQTTTQ